MLWDVNGIVSQDKAKIRMVYCTARISVDTIGGEENRNPELRTTNDFRRCERWYLIVLS